MLTEVTLSGGNINGTATRQAGFDDHLVKPVDLARLLDAVERITVS